MIERVGKLTEDQRDQLIDGEEDPYGVADDPTKWSEKTHHATLRDGGGRLIAAVGLVVADVTAGGEAFSVVGIGAVFVTWEHRGHGHLRPVLEDALEWAATFGPERAMLWCSDKNVALYARFGFEQITAPVTVDQPGGETHLLMGAMWRPLREGVAWPEGDVRVLSLPF
jgi:predicted GNAT family N-acyltransferase